MGSVRLGELSDNGTKGHRMTLYPRRSGRSTDTDTTARAMAHRILDRLKAGEHVKPALVDWALRITGDLSD